MSQAAAVKVAEGRQQEQQAAAGMLKLYALQKNETKVLGVHIVAGHMCSWLNRSSCGGGKWKVWAKFPGSPAGAQSPQNLWHRSPYAMPLQYEQSNFMYGSCI